MIVCPKLNNLKNIKHAFFTRNGGVSTGIYASLNCGPGSNDDKQNVKKNREIAMQKLGASDKTLCTLYQCHSNEVIVLNAPSDHDPARKADALVTRNNEIVLGILTADCAPILFADTKSNLIAAAHAGWKGSIGGVLENTVAKMYELGAQHQDIIASVGPCIGPDSYEVGKEFREKFLHEDKDSYDFFRIIPKPDHYLFDLPGYVVSRLNKLGLRSVQWVGKDTLPNESEFFSFRRSTLRQETDYGRQLSSICLL